MKLPALKENVTSYIALGFTIMYFVMKCLILFCEFKISETILVQIESSMDNMEVMVLAYYFGSSKKPTNTIENVENVDMKK